MTLGLISPEKYLYNMAHINIIVCIAQNGAIGLKGGLIYHLRADLQQFKHLTTGHTVLMGRKTYESLPKGALPNRRNIVLTRQAGKEWSNVETYPSMEEALKHCDTEEEVFVMGGSSVYAEALPYADTLYLTQVKHIPQEADTFFPTLHMEDWEEIQKEHHEVDEQNEQPFDFITLKRKKQ